jgi:YbgC/YbaW family acyl-CoA thioester hydrolase
VSFFHRLDVRVMWPDTDPAGIVWWGVFCRYFENAEEDLYRVLGSDRTTLLRDLRIFMPRTAFSCGFRSPAKLGDEISIGISVGAITDRRVRFVCDVRERGTDRLILDASYRVACVDAKTFAPRAFPAELVSLLTPALGAAPQRHGGGLATEPRSDGRQ